MTMLLEEIIASLPPEPLAEEICIGPFDTVVKSSRWGMSSTFRDPCHGAWVRGAGELLNRPAVELARLALSERLLEASLGMAALNSLLDIDGFNFHEINASRLILEKGRDKNVAVVGEFPFLGKLKDEVRNLWIINRSPWEGEEGIEEARQFLPRADVVALTASSFINHSFDDLLSLCPDAYTLILGPSTPFSPLLLRRGVDALCGALVDDPPRVLRHIRQGSSFRLIRGMKLLTVFKDEYFTT